MSYRSLFAFSLIAIASVCAAQEGPPPRELMLIKRIFVALQPKVETELKLTADEKTKIMDAFEGTLEVEGDRISIRLNGSQDLGAMETAAIKVLDASQQQRLEEVWLQKLMGIAIADEKVAKKLGLTAQQKRETDRLLEDGGNAIAGLLSGSPSKEDLKQISDIRAKFGKKIQALLTDEQKGLYEKMQGKPFSLKGSG